MLYLQFSLYLGKGLKVVSLKKGIKVVSLFEERTQCCILLEKGLKVVSLFEERTHIFSLVYI